MREDQKNLFLAMGLSLLVIVGWQYFYAGPKQERARETIEVPRGDKRLALPALDDGVRRIDGEKLFVATKGIGPAPRAHRTRTMGCPPLLLR